MKKLLLLVCSLLLAAAAMAQSAQKIAGEYTGALYISLGEPINAETEAMVDDNGKTATYKVTIEAQSDNTVRFGLYNFGFGALELGDIILDDVPVSEGSDGSVRFGKNDPVSFHFIPDVDGGLKATASISEQSVVNGTHAVVDVDVMWVEATADGDMPIYVRFEGDKAAAGRFQVPNSDFETWGHANEPGSGWFSFHSAGGAQASVGKSMSEPLTTRVTGSEAHNGGTSVRIESKWVGVLFFGANANGNLTTGKINMGSTTPANSANYNFTDRSSENSCPFDGRPDSLAYWAKYTRGQSGTYTGRCRAVIHGDTDYIDPYATESDKAKYLVAETEVYCDVTNTWTRFCGPLTYTGTEAEKSYLLATFTTNETPGGSTGDLFYIDDVEFIYNSELSKATYDGEELVFKDGAAKVEDVYDPEKLQLLSNGRAATITTVFDEESFLLTVTVKGQNISEKPDNLHRYSVQFLDPAIVAIRTAEMTARPTAAGTAYDLQGRRLGKAASHGISIEGGKKLLVK